MIDQDKSLMKVQVECSILVVRNCGYYLGIKERQHVLQVYMEHNIRNLLIIYGFTGYLLQLRAFYTLPMQ